jgi:hypothetical protein
MASLVSTVDDVSGDDVQRFSESGLQNEDRSNNSTNEPMIHLELNVVDSDQAQSLEASENSVESTSDVKNWIKRTVSGTGFRRKSFVYSTDGTDPERIQQWKFSLVRSKQSIQLSFNICDSGT